MSSHTQEIFDFAQMEPKSIRDLGALVEECTAEELKEVELIASNILNAVRNTKAKRLYKNRDR
jgi:hypothetical protein